MFHLPLEQIESIRNIGIKIEKLPALNLKEKQLKFLANFVDFNDITSEEQLDKLLEEDGKWFLSEPHATHMVNYLHCWLGLGSDLLNCVKYFRTLWKNLGKPFGSDDLVPLFMELLPSDKNQLQKIVKQLNTALQVSNASMYACYLTNLFVAVTSKLNQPNFKADMHVQEIADEIKKLALVIQLHLVCIERMDDISVDLHKRIPDLVLPDMLLQKFKDDPLPDDTFSAVKIFDAQEAEINVLMEHYKILWDLHSSLMREKNNATQRLVEFLAKLEHFMLQPVTLDKTFLQKVNAIYPLDTTNPLFAIINEESVTRNFFSFFTRKDKAQPPVTPSSSVNKSPAP